MAERRGPPETADLQNSGHLHQRDELGLHAVTEAAGQLQQQSFKRPQLLQLLNASPRQMLVHTVCECENMQHTLQLYSDRMQCASMLAVAVRRWYLGEVQHAAAEGRGGAEQSLNEASAELEAVGHGPHISVLQQGEEDQSQVHPLHCYQIHALQRRQATNTATHHSSVQSVHFG